MVLWWLGDCQGCRQENLVGSMRGRSHRAYLGIMVAHITLKSRTFACHDIKSALPEHEPPLPPAFLSPSTSFAGDREA